MADEKDDPQARAMRSDKLMQEYDQNKQVSDADAKGDPDPTRYSPQERPVNKPGVDYQDVLRAGYKDYSDYGKTAKRTTKRTGGK